MDAAVRAYAEYRAGPDHDFLGRFVVPASRLTEFSESARGILPESGRPWRLSGIASGDPQKARESIDLFNSFHSDGAGNGLAVCDVVEMPVDSREAIATVLQAFPANVELYMEVGASHESLPLIRDIAATRASAKIRTGGVVESAIPPADQVVRFIEVCVEEGVPLKATAGLHHAIRGSYPLTYEPGSPSAMLYGYLNVFLAAALCAAGASESAVMGVLEETDPTELHFDDRSFWWKDHVVLLEQLAVIRQNVATSFGSCSFTEPVSEAKALGII